MSVPAESRMQPTPRPVQFPTLAAWIVSAAVLTVVFGLVFSPTSVLAGGANDGDTAVAGTALANMEGAGGDPAQGEKVFNRYCNTCHVTTENVNRIGPSFHGLYGRRPGTLASYRSWYSRAMKAYGDKIEVWNEETLFTYLESPRRVVKGTKMGFPGLPDPKDRRDVIAYLKTVAGN